MNAIEIATKIRANVVSMQAGRTTWEDFKAINGALWADAARSDISDAVNVALKAIQ